MTEAVKPLNKLPPCKKCYSENTELLNTVTYGRDILCGDCGYEWIEPFVDDLKDLDTSNVGC